MKADYAQQKILAPRIVRPSDGPDIQEVGKEVKSDAAPSSFLLFDYFMC